MRRDRNDSLEFAWFSLLKPAGIPCVPQSAEPVALEKQLRSAMLSVLLVAALWFVNSSKAMAQGQFEVSSDQPDQLVVVPPPPELLDDTCVVSVLNRTTSVNADGTWILPTVPANFGPVRARATCVRNGITLFGQSDLFTLTEDQSVTLPQIILGNVSLVPNSISVSAPLTAFTQTGQSSQLSVMGAYQGGSNHDLTAASSGTLYQVSNPAVATVSRDGLVTAVSSGTAIIQALNEGAQGLLQVQVSLGIDSDGDGIPDDAELRLGLNPHDPTDALLDPDHDGLTNLQEYQAGTDMNNPDSDGDGLLDGQEVLQYHSNPLAKDSDGDGIPDGIEVQTGSNPVDPASFFLDKALASIEVKPSNFLLTVNALSGQASQQLSVVGHLIDGTTTLDLTSTQKGTSYNSSDLNVCNFGSPDGNIFAGTNGGCTITISNSGFNAQATGIISSFSPTALSYVAIPGFANGVAVNGNYAYVAAGASGLQVINVSDRSSPAMVGSLALPGNADDVKLIGNTAIVAAGTAGIHAIDISNPAQPVLLGTLATSGTAMDLALTGNTAYVANGTSLFLANISNPAAMTEVSSIPLAGTIRGVAVDPDRGLAVVAASTNGIYLVDVSTPATPIQRSQVAISNAHQVAIKGTYAIVANYHTTTTAYQSSLVSVDISSPSAPLIVSSLTNQSLSGNLNDVAVLGNFALSADVFFVNGIPIADISDPTQLQSRETLTFRQRDDNGMGIAVDASYAYLTTDHTAIDKFGTIGDSRLYIGQYQMIQDTNGIPPVVSISSPITGATVIEGSTIAMMANASDDVGVAGVTFQVNGKTVFTSTSSPYQFSYTVPIGVSSLNIGATAIDFGNNAAKAVDVLLNVIPDPETTVLGQVVNGGNPVSGATVTTNGGKSATTAADGSFSIPGVPTTLGDIQVVVTAMINGAPIHRTSAFSVVVVGGTTDVGTIQMTPIVMNFENVPGLVAMSYIGGAVPTNARLSTQFQLEDGASLTSTVGYVALVNLGVGQATSGINGIGGVNASNLLSYGSPVVVTFTLPGDPATSAVTDFVSLRGDQFSANGFATMQAFDVNGVLLGSDTEPDRSGGLKLSLTIRGIHSIRVTETQPNIAFDDLTFDPVSTQ